MIIFDDLFRARLLDLFVRRRDVRRFRAEPLPPETLERLIGIACLAPSVGLSQPWRFVIVDDPVRRHAIADVFKDCNAEALASYSGDRAACYAKLKLAAIEEAPAQLTVFADRGTRWGTDWYGGPCQRSSNTPLSPPCTRCGWRPVQRGLT